MSHHKKQIICRGEANTCYKPENTIKFAAELFLSNTGTNSAYIIGLYEKIIGCN